jgi:hypothetical protein
MGDIWDKFKQAGDDTIAVFNGEKIWDPWRQEYIPVPPRYVPAEPAPDLYEPGPNSTDARLQHIQMLVDTGRITEQEAAELRRRVTSGI